ncbi:MAG: ATP synthase F1 subunit gamma [Candidatus Kapaibacterium sp.]
MATLRDIRQRISAVKSTAKITSAMKMVAAAKMKKAQGAIESARPYYLKLQEITDNLIKSVGSEYSHPLLEIREDVNRIALMVITSDRGLCGSFNANLQKKTVRDMNVHFAKEFPGAEIDIVAIGRKACQFYPKRGYNVIEKYPGIFNTLEYEVAREILEKVRDKFLEGIYDRVFVYFNEFVSVVSQNPVFNQILPVVPESHTEQQEIDNELAADYIFEPNKVEILDVLIPRLVNTSFWRSMLESNAAEQAARMFAMDNATTNAKELINHLQLVYNRERQAAITTEMLEIVSGANALKGA